MESSRILAGCGALRGMEMLCETTVMSSNWGRKKSLEGLGFSIGESRKAEVLRDLGGWERVGLGG